MELGRHKGTPTVQPFVPSSIFHNKGISFKSLQSGMPCNLADSTVSHKYTASIFKWRSYLPQNIINHQTTNSNNQEKIGCGFDRASSLICGNKMPTRCNRWFLLQILLLAQHVSGHHYAHHQELESIIQVVAACRIWCCKTGNCNFLC